MKPAKLWIRLLPLLALAFAWTPDVRADTETVNGITWTYTVSDGKASVGGGSWESTAVPTGTTGDIAIPSTLGGCPVTSIGREAFFLCDGLTSVTIPDSVTSIGISAFANCIGLTSVAIPGSVTSIGSGAFAQCYGLTSVTIPDSVTIIGMNAFANCRGLMSVTIPDSVTIIGPSAFAGCCGLTSVTIPDGVTSIEFQTFEGCSGLTSVTIPDSVTSIGNDVFLNCDGLGTLFVPERLRNSMANAGVPSGCKVFYTGRTVVDGVEWGYVTDDVEVTVTGGPTDGVVEIPSVLRGCPVVAVGEGAFRNAAGLTRVVIPDGVTSIGDQAFAGCVNLTSVVIPDSVTSIGDQVFAGCVNLTSVTIPDSVVEISQSAFDGCNKYWASLFRGVGAPVGGPQAVSLTVTNVVVHFVTQSVPSAAVTPATNATGIVNIIAEVTASNAVAIAQDWAAQYPGFEAAFGADFTAALTMETGKRDGAGRPLRVWQDYVAGTDPTDPASLFAASIVHDAQTGDMIVSCSPELAPAEAAKRRYSVYGKANLTDPGWTLLGTGLPWRASENSVFHFFRVTVEMR